jgi:hypothetical protein
MDENGFSKGLCRHLLEVEEGFFLVDLLWELLSFRFEVGRLWRVLGEFLGEFLKNLEKFQ